MRNWCSESGTRPCGVGGDEVDRHLSGRGLSLTQYPAAIRCHPALGYFQKEGNATSKGRRVPGDAGLRACGEWRRGDAAPYLSVRRHKLTAADEEGAVRRFLRRCRAARRSGRRTHTSRGHRDRHRGDAGYRQPVYRALSAGNPEKVLVPETRQISIYADNDADGDFTGQSAFCTGARGQARGEGHVEMRARLPAQEPGRRLGRRMAAASVAGAAACGMRQFRGAVIDRTRFFSGGVASGAAPPVKRPIFPLVAAAPGRACHGKGCPGVLGAIHRASSRPQLAGHSSTHAGMCVPVDGARRRRFLIGDLS